MIGYLLFKESIEIAFLGLTWFGYRLLSKRLRKDDTLVANICIIIASACVVIQSLAVTFVGYEIALTLKGRTDSFVVRYYMTERPEL